MMAIGCVSDGFLVHTPRTPVTAGVWAKIPNDIIGNIRGTEGNDGNRIKGVGGFDAFLLAFWVNSPLLPGRRGHWERFANNIIGYKGNTGVRMKCGGTE